jgi:hypothetical protein
MDLGMGRDIDHDVEFPRKPPKKDTGLENFKRIDFARFMRSRNDPVRDKVERYHDMFGDIMESVMTNDDPYVDWQWTCGYDFFKKHFPKLTYYIACSFNEYVKFHYDGVLLWHFDPDMQKQMFENYKIDDDLISNLQARLDYGHTKHDLKTSGNGVIPFDNYDLVVLQDFTGARNGDIWDGKKMLAKSILDATKNKRPTVVRPHPYVTQDVPRSTFNRIRDGEWDYVFLAEDDFHPNDLVRGADKVIGTSSSLLIDAMIQQKDVTAYCNGDFAHITNADIEQQNRWLSWFFNDRCINMGSTDVESEVRKRLDLAWSGKTWIKEKGKPKRFDHHKLRR